MVFLLHVKFVLLPSVLFVSDECYENFYKECDLMMYENLQLLQMWLFFLCLAFHEGLADSYAEELRVRRLAAGNLLTEFRLNITSDYVELGRFFRSSQ